MEKVRAEIKISKEREREIGGLLWPSLTGKILRGTGSVHRLFFSYSLLYEPLACAAGGISGPVEISLQMLYCLSSGAERRLGTAMGGGSAKTVPMRITSPSATQVMR